ncbi:MAG: FAD-dependent oxidoreductase [Candidatus Latescibacterota bacterium]
MDIDAYNRGVAEGTVYDLVVCYGGPVGIPAALAASRNGLKVLLIEQTSQLGGSGTLDQLQKTGAIVGRPEIG